MNPAALREAIFDALNVIDVTILLSDEYGAIPAIFSEAALQATDSGAGEFFPYVSFSVPSDFAYNDKGRTGSSSVVQIDVWSRSGIDECETITRAIYESIDRTSIGVVGHIETQCEEIRFSLDPDGLTRRGLMSFRVIALA